MPKWFRAVAIIATLLLVQAGAIAWAQGGSTHVLLVLDASGSMFNKLADGQYRITAAKDAVAGFVSRLPAAPDLHVGLRVYGARVAALDDTACEDSELVVPVDGFDRDRLLGAVRGTQAKGATPIAYSLELALDDLRGADGRAIVVLVTDGIESCGGDVRAAVEDLTSATSRSTCASSASTSTTSPSAASRGWAPSRTPAASRSWRQRSGAPSTWRRSPPSCP
jgi:Ca-activated chloride channel homolog